MPERKSKPNAYNCTCECGGGGGVNTPNDKVVTPEAQPDYNQARHIRTTTCRVLPIFERRSIVHRVKGVVLL